MCKSFSVVVLIGRKRVLERGIILAGRALLRMTGLLVYLLKSVAEMTFGQGDGHVAGNHTFLIDGGTAIVK
jgi:hypothetical protein